MAVNCRKGFLQAVVAATLVIGTVAVAPSSAQQSQGSEGARPNFATPGIVVDPPAIVGPSQSTVPEATGVPGCQLRDPQKLELIIS